MTAKYLCQQYEPGTAVFETGQEESSYFAAVDCSQLPAERRREDHIVERGAAGLVHRWFFFPAAEPAFAFVRAARMSADRGSVHHGVWYAARETKFCHRHDRDETVLLVDVHGENLDRADDEIDRLKRFVQGVKEHQWSSPWVEPTGYITELDRGSPRTTRRRSLPL